VRKIADQIIIGEIIELKNSDDVSYLGYNLKLIDCILDIRASARSIVITQTELFNCTIIAKKLSKFEWRRVKLENCQFKGIFLENNFGNSLIEAEYPTIIKDCDFSHAKIDSTRFYDVDMKTIKLPTKPFITIFEPGGFSKYVTQSRMLEKLGSFFKFLSLQDNHVTAFTFESNRIAKNYDLDVEEVNFLLETIDLYNKIVFLKESTECI
jgi:uncharacterized protein YhbP (UPF0306 family)